MIDQEEIHNQCFSEDSEERIRGLEQLRSNFSLISNRDQAWNDLHTLTNDKCINVKWKAVDTFFSVFSYISDRKQTWDWLHRLATDEDSNTKWKAMNAFCSLFPQAPDKEQLWDNLHILTIDKNSYVRLKAVDTICSVIFHVPNKQQAWSDLYRLANEKNDTGYGATDSFDSSEYSPKTMINNIKSRATYALFFIFPQVPDKQQAWDDLIKIANDQSTHIGTYVCSALSSILYHVPDKEKAWDDLLLLADSEDIVTGAYANHSLGKISIYKASQAKDEKEYKKELEKAIDFFEKATKRLPYMESNPAKFCLPFYRSFYSLIFERQKKARKEVDNYLAEAKHSIAGSKSKKLLLEAVENLANALKEVQNLENLNLEAMKGELNIYRIYCDHAEKILVDIEEDAPFATIAVRKGLPILNRNLKSILEEIQNKAKIICQESQGTSTQEIASDVYREVQKWEIGSQEEMSWYVPNLVRVLKSKIPHTLENKEILDMIESMNYEKDLTRQYNILPIIIGLIPTVNVIPADPVIEKMESSQREILEAIRKIGGRLDYISAAMSPGISEELILHLGYITSAGGVEYTLTIPLQELSCSEIKDELKEIAGKRISQLSMMPKKTAKIVEDYLVKNKMEDLLNKLR